MLRQNVFTVLIYEICLTFNLKATVWHFFSLQFKDQYNDHEPQLQYIWLPLFSENISSSSKLIQEPKAQEKNKENHIFRGILLTNVAIPKRKDARNGF